MKKDNIRIMRIYLDNCCYNRPYDDQTQITIQLESQAKLMVQNWIRSGRFDLVTSDMLHYEVHNSPYIVQERAIADFIENYSAIHVGYAVQTQVETKASEIMKTGVKYKDACHVASAILASCDYFLTTDGRLLKYRTDEIKMCNPVDFVREIEVCNE